MAERKKVLKATLIGKVVGNKTKNTVTIVRENRQIDPKYHKILQRTRKYTAHDEGSKCSLGDIVKVQFSKPISKTKRWKVVEIIEKAK